MTFIPLGNPANTFPRTSNTERCWAKAPNGYGICTHMACTSLGLCGEHLDEFREASREPSA